MVAAGGRTCTLSSDRIGRPRVPATLRSFALWRVAITLDFRRACRRAGVWCKGGRPAAVVCRNWTASTSGTWGSGAKRSSWRSCSSAPRLAVARRSEKAATIGGGVVTGVSAVLKLGGSILYLLLLETRRLCLFVCYLFYIRSRRAAARRSLPQPDSTRPIARWPSPPRPEIRTPQPSPTPTHLRGECEAF